MKTLAHILASLAFVGGLALLVIAYAYPSQFRMTDASAIQAQQVYVTSAHYALLGIGVLLAGVLLECGVIAAKE